MSGEKFVRNCTYLGATLKMLPLGGSFEEELAFTCSFKDVARYGTTLFGVT